MKRACLLSISLLVGLFAAYFWLLHGRIEFPGDLVLALFCALFGAVFIGSVVTYIQHQGLEAAFRRAERGQPPEDGRIGVVTGEIYPIEGGLLSPFERQECVAYEYDVLPAATGKKAGSDYAGVALAPSVIRTARGSFAMLGWALLDDFKKRRLEEPEARQNAERYLGQTTFEKLSVLGVVSQLEGLLTDDDGSVRKDWRIAADEGEIHLSGRHLQERCVRVGATVTLVGTYSAARGGFVPPKGRSTMNQLFAGDASSALGKLRGKATTGLVMGAVFFLFTHGILALILSSKG